MDERGGHVPFNARLAPAIADLDAAAAARATGAAGSGGAALVEVLAGILGLNANTSY